jgi:hypothetical protein
MATPITEEQRKKYAEDHEKATLIKEAIKIVNELGKIEWDDMGMSEDDMEHLEALVSRSKKLIRHRLWKL